MTGPPKVLTQLLQKVLIILILVTTLGGTLFAASTAGMFTENPVSVRSLSLGNCSAAQVDSAGFYTNAAAPRMFEWRSFNLLQGRLLNDVNYLSLNYVQPKFSPWDMGFGFSYLSSGLDGIQEATYDSTTGTAALTGKDLSYSAKSYLFSFSKDLAPNFYGGVNLKILQESLAGETSSGFGMDSGFLYTLNDKTLLGLSLINISKPKLQWSTNAVTEVNQKAVFGINYKLTEQLALLGDLEKIENTPLSTLIGAEFKPFEVFAFRIGFAKDKLTLGTGLNYNQMILDYAYVDNKDKELGLTQYISVSLLLASENILTQDQTEQERQQALEEAIRTEKLRQELQNSLTTPATTGSAEIAPLPLPGELIPAELVPTTEIIAEATPTTDVVPIIDETIGEEATINLVEEYQTPIHDYNIALMTARYYKSGKLICKVFIDNTGNQTDVITANFRVLNKQGVIKEFAIESVPLNNKETKVLYYTLEDSKLAAGTYYIETKLQTNSAEKYQKEKYIKRE